jgi:hypothetical protein
MGMKLKRRLDRRPAGSQLCIAMLDQQTREARFPLGFYCVVQNLDQGFSEIRFEV